MELLVGFGWKIKRSLILTKKERMRERLAF